MTDRLARAWLTTPGALSACLLSACLLSACLLAGCGGGGDADGGGGADTSMGGGTLGDPCGGDRDCLSPFVCRASVCSFAANGAAGSPCTYTEECAEGLYCDDDRACATAGTGGDGAACASTADCLRLFVCAPEPGGSVCRMAGDRGIGSTCIRADQCRAGLYCVASTCSATPSGPGADAGMEEDGGRPGWDAGPPRGCVTSSECDDGVMCTVESCVADFCVYSLVDSDEDGYASTVIPGGCGRDCCDENREVHPDHMAFETSRFSCPATLQPDTFDWNCDGTEEHQHVGVLPDCDPKGGCPNGAEGWVGSEPECGGAGNWARCTMCRVEIVEAGRRQGCR